jgi:hypothetical protein
MNVLEAPENVTTVHQLRGCATKVHCASKANFFDPDSEDVHPQIQHITNLCHSPAEIQHGARTDRSSIDRWI